MALKVGRFITILKRGRTYYAEVYANGQQTRQSLGTRNLKAAREEALDLDAKLQRGEMPTRPQRIELAEAIDLYLSYVEGEGRRPSTLKQYRYDLGAFLRHASGQGVRYLDQINLLLVEKFRASQRKAGFAEKTLQHRTIVVKQLIKWSEERDLLLRNPLKGLKVKKAQPSPQPCYTIEQVEVILDAAEGQQRDILEVLAFTGMRIGELVWLTWDDVDFDKGFIRIRPKDDWVPKHNRSRVIPMHGRAEAVLETVAKKHRWVFTALRSKEYPKGGHQISGVHVLERLKKILKKLGIEGHLHTFRHFFISHCANSGVPAFQLIKWVRPRGCWNGDALL